MPALLTDRPPRRIALLLAGFTMVGPFSIDAIFPGFHLSDAFGRRKVILCDERSVKKAGITLGCGTNLFK